MGGANNILIKQKKPRVPYQALKIVQEALEEIRKLDPTCEEIVEYAKGGGYGIITYTNSDYYFGPRLHDTWGIKFGGSVHIDIGCGGYHLMLDKYSAWEFVEFIKGKREGR